MQAYSPDALRNVALVGHGGSGKTTLVDCLAWASGTTHRHGSVDDGTALTDSAPDEVQKHHSISLGVAYVEWYGTKLNLLDTPGAPEFVGEDVCALAVADAALLVLSATDGVQVGSEKAWELCDRYQLPRMIVVTQMDKEQADFARVYDDIRTHLTPKALPVEVPIRDAHGFHGLVNLFSGHCHEFVPGAKGRYERVEIPDALRPQVQAYTDQLLEAVAATDDGLIERYLNGEPIPREDVTRALRQAVIDGAIVPLFAVSGTDGHGVRTLLKEMVELLPSPLDIPAPADVPLLGRVFKTQSEPHVGEVTFFRLYRGELQSGTEVWNAEHGVAEKLAHLSIPLGRERQEVDRLVAGDIGCVAKLKDTHTGDTFCRREAPVRLPEIAFPEATATAAIVTARGEEDKLAAALHRLHEEDPSFHFEYHSEIGQTLLHGMGERHFDILLGRLASRYGVKAELARPRVAYRETFKGRAEGQGKHKKQTGGRGQYGDCRIRIAPLPRGSGIRFVDAITGGVIPGKYLPAVERGIVEAAERGVLSGHPVTDFEVTCYDGSYHDVDSSEMAFRAAGALAFRTVAPNARPVLLEPVMAVDVWAPDELLGDVLGDLSGRRGHIVGTEPDGRATRVRAFVPQAELYRYATVLHALTRGRGRHHEQFHAYAEAPPEVAAKVAKENQEARQGQLAAAH
ncbi:MAG: elongation factor G [Gemmatimonadales bacterium]|nr:elongation factor G [Gemmatimonadales bacterium]